MKKLLAIMLAGALALSLVACGSKDKTESGNSGETNTNISGTLSEIMEKITDVPSLEIMTMEDTLTAENFEYHTKIATMPEGLEGIVSDAAINAQAHSVVLLRVPAGTDGETLANEILTKHTDNSPSKWVCVAPEKVEVVQKGDIILFVQSQETVADEIVAKFNELA